MRAYSSELLRKTLSSSDRLLTLSKINYVSQTPNFLLDELRKDTLENIQGARLFVCTLSKICIPILSKLHVMVVVIE